MATRFADDHHEEVVYDIIDGTSTTYTLDASTDLLPQVEAPVVDTSSGSIHVPMSGPPAGAVMILDLFYSRASTGYAWQVDSPPIADLVLPPLPADLASFRTMTGDTVTRTETFIQDATTISRWDQARTNPKNVFEPYWRGHVPVGARMRYSFNY